MRSTKELLEELELEHTEYQFESFSNSQALEIGLRLIKIAEQRRFAVSIDITRYGQQLFHYSCEGTSSDNDAWIRRKSRVVEHFGKSSLYMKYLLRQKRTSLQELFALDAREYSFLGGSFPIILKHTGPIGAITVSGLTDDEDHALIINALKLT